MKQRTALILSLGLTAFVLVIVGAVAALAAEERRSPEPEPAPVEDVGLEQILNEREGELKAALEQANKDLEEAYATIEELRGDQDSNEEVDTVVYPISPDLAVGLALNLSPDSELKKWPELVDFRGTAAYEVLLTHGPVYISATDALLLYDGTVSSLAGEGGGDGYEDDDHDEDHDDDHEDEHEEEYEDEDD